jgi:DNA-binding transcriptional regulator YiaG
VNLTDQQKDLLRILVSNHELRWGGSSSPSSLWAEPDFLMSAEVPFRCGVNASDNEHMQRAGPPEKEERSDLAGSTALASQRIAERAMAAIPALSESTKRKLAVQWDTLRDKQKLTDEDLSGYDLGRQWLLGIVAKPPRGMNLGGLNTSRPKQAACWLGLDPSIRAAEGRFRGIDSEYWSHWCSSGTGYETYAGWLDILKREISAEIESIWKGRTIVTDRWFQGTCAPAIEKALAALAKQRVAQARDFETRRLERAPSTARTATGNPIEGAQGRESPALWHKELRAARENAKLSRPDAAKRLKNQGIQITADAIKKHEEGKAKPRPAVRKAYAVIYETPESALFPSKIPR